MVALSIQTATAQPFADTKVLLRLPSHEPAGANPAKLQRSQHLTFRIPVPA